MLKIKPKHIGYINWLGEKWNIANITELNTIAKISPFCFNALVKIPLNINSSQIAGIMAKEICTRLESGGLY